MSKDSYGEICKYIGLRLRCATEWIILTLQADWIPHISIYR